MEVMKQKRVLAFSAVAVVLLAGSGAGAWAWWRAHRPAAQPVVAAPKPELPAGTEVRLSGPLQAANLLLIGAPVDGVTEEFAVKPGDEVYEGQILGRIANDGLKQHERDTATDVERAQLRLAGLDSDLIAIRLEESRVSASTAHARIERQRADAVYQRQSLLNREGATPRRIFEKAQQDFEAASREAVTQEALETAVRDRVQRVLADMEAAKSVLADKEKTHDQAKADLASADLLAPADGLILAIKKTAGEEVDRSMTDLIQMATDLSQLELVIEPEPAVLKRIAAGQPARVEVAELPGDGLPATIKSIDGTKVVLEFASPTTLIRPGMVAVGVLKLN